MDDSRRAELYRARARDMLMTAEQTKNEERRRLLELAATFYYLARDIEGRPRPQQTENEERQLLLELAATFYYLGRRH